MAPPVAETDTDGCGNQGNIPGLREHGADRRGGQPHARCVQPTRALEAGDRVSSRTAATRDPSVWLLSSGSGIELAQQLQVLLTVLEPVAAQLWDLIRDGYEANWFCYIASHATEHAAELDRQTMQPTTSKQAAPA